MFPTWSLFNFLARRLTTACGFSYYRFKPKKPWGGEQPSATHRILTRLKKRGRLQETASLAVR